MSEFFGMYLREAREKKGLSVDDVVRETKIQKRYIEAIESDNFEELPGETYTKGFLKNYAQTVGLSPDDVVERYQSYLMGNDVEIKENIKRAIERLILMGYKSLHIYLTKNIFVKISES